MMPNIPDLGLLPTVEVAVVRRSEAGTDAFGAPVWREEPPELVAGVLAVTGATADLGASRPEGSRAAMTFYLPKGYSKPLKGCFVEHGGRRYRVVGDPQPFAAGWAPGAWGVAAETEAVDG